VEYGSVGVMGKEKKTEDKNRKCLKLERKTSDKGQVTRHEKKGLLVTRDS